MAKTKDSPKKTTKKGGKKNKKDPNAPKKPLSAYFCFLMKRRPELLKENPDLQSKVSEVAKLLGEEWKGLTEAQKKTYKVLADKDKDRYAKELEQYNKKGKNAAQDEEDEEEDEEEDD